MSTWDELLSLALIGTDRRASTVDAGGVLDGAAAWAVYRRAGLVADSGVAPPAPAGAESWPVVGDAAARRLAALLIGDVGPIDSASRGLILAEWLSVAAARHRRVPPAVLPDLLDYGRYHADLREPISAVGGVRIQWLAGQNPDWRYLTTVESTSEDPSAWSTGTPGQRVGYLRRLRGADPDAARDLLETEWRTLTGDERSDLVAVLDQRLGPADEALLERALDDRRQSVRDNAARLLARLPGSAYAGRMAERAQAALTVTDGTVAAVALPTECDPGMGRDGIAPKPPTGLGARAWWLQEILARTPLSTWPAVLTVEPAAQEWAASVYSGLAQAAAGQRDPVWAAAMLDHLGDDVRDRNLASALYPVLEPTELVERAVLALRRGRTPVWGSLLASCPAPWPEPLAAAVVAGIEALAGRPELGGELHRLVRLAGVRMAPALLPESTVDAVDDLATILRYRHEMSLEIA